MKSSVIQKLAWIVLGVLIGVFFVMRTDHFPEVAAHFFNQQVALGNQATDVKKYEAFPDPSPRIRAVSRDVTPSVVYIQIYGNAQKQQQNPFQNDEFFKRFFPEFEHPNQRRNQPQGEQLVSAGSGVIVSEDGYILTNNHVVENASEEGIRVFLNDKREFVAKLVGRDTTTDMAVIKVDGKDLPHAPLGDSDQIEVGDFVLAIGTPLSQNLSSTVTMGIVSAIGRNIGIIGERYGIESFIQTDAAINPGNSGGPLVNMNGQVIGINSAIATRTGGYQGYGFSIPVNLAKKVATDLIKDGRVSRGLVGVQMQEMTPAMSKAEGLTPGKGVIVQGVIEKGPAEKAGILPGDIIVEIDGNTIGSGNQVQAYVGKKRPGDSVKMTILRNKKEQIYHVTLMDKDELEGNNISRTTTQLARERESVPVELKKLGIEVRQLTAQEKKEWKVDSGLLITSVSTKTARELSQGVLITEVDRKKVESSKDLEEILKGFKEGSAVLMKIRSADGNTQYVGVEIKN